MHSETKLQVAVLGTGLPALSAAYLIQKAGHNVSVLDTDCGYVRLGRTFPYGGGRFDQFIQTVSPGDKEVFGLCSELRIELKLEWYVPGRPGLRRFFNRNSKVAIPAGLSQRLELELRDHVSVQQVSEASDLMEDDYSVELRTNHGRRQFDSIISTLPLEALEEMTRGLLAHDLPRSQARQRTLVSVVFISSVPLLNKYATFVETNCLPFTALASYTDPETGLTAITVCGCSEAPAMELKLLALRFLSENFAEFQPSNVEAVRVFISSERMPVYPFAETNAQTSTRVGEGRLFLACRELGYGLPVSMNTGLLLAKRAVDAFLECVPTIVCGVRPIALAAAR